MRVARFKAIAGCLLLASAFAVEAPTGLAVEVVVEPQLVGSEQPLTTENKPESLVDLYCRTMAAAPVYDRVKNFPLNDIVARCKKDHAYDGEDMELLERELKRYLYLCVVSPKSMGMYSKHVDNLWHTFILFTREYFAFCNLVNGGYIHHNPVREGERAAISEQQKAAGHDYAEFIKLYESTFGNLENNQELVIDPIWLLDGVLAQEEQDQQQVTEFVAEKEQASQEAASGIIFEEEKAV